MIPAVIRTLLPRNALLIVSFTAVGLLQWVYLKLVALAQAPEEFGRFAAATFLGVILLAPAFTLQNGIARQIAVLTSSGRARSVGPYLRGLLRRWRTPTIVLGVVLLIAAGPVTRLLNLGSVSSVRLLVGILAITLPLQLALGTLAGRDRLPAFVGLMAIDGGLRCSIAFVAPALVDTAPAALTVQLLVLGLTTVVGLALVRSDLTADTNSGSEVRFPRAVLPGFLGGALLLFAVAFQDTLLARTLLDDTTAARYGAAVMVARLIHVLPMPMIPVLVPAVARLAGAGKSSRRVLAFHLILLAGPCTAAVLTGIWRPDLIGGLMLDPRKYADLGILIPLAFAVASCHAMTNLTMHALLAQRRLSVIPVLAVALAIGIPLALTSPPEASTLLVRMLALAGALFATVLLLACRRPRETGN